MSKYTIQSGTPIDNFETLDDWTVSGTGATIELDTVNVKDGGSGLKVKSVNGVNAYAIKNVSLDLSTANVFTAWVYIDDITKYSNVTTGLIYLYTGATDYFLFSLKTTVMQSGLNKILFAKSEATTNGTPSWDSTVTQIRIRCLSQVGQTSNLTISKLAFNEYSRPKIILMFDDGNATDYSIAFPYMRARGLVGSLAVPGDNVGALNNITLSQLQEMYAAGWEIINHSYNHVDLTTLSGEEVKTELLRDIDYIEQNGWGEGGKFMAWPFSAFNDTAVSACKEVGMKAARTGVQGYNPHDSTTPLVLKRQESTNALELPILEGWVDSVVAVGGLLIINLHDIDDALAAVTDTSVANFYGLIDKIAPLHHGNVLDVVTLQTWYRGLTNPRKQA